MLRIALSCIARLLKLMCPVRPLHNLTALMVT